MAEFVVGGARSGKSRYAAGLVAADPDVTLIATALAGDAETEARIEHHRASRDETWQVVEEPYAPVDSIRAVAADGRTVIVDCLTMWLANLHYGEAAPQRAVEESTAELVETLTSVPGRIIVISNEIGSGLVPPDPATRRFVDDLGRLNQSVAAACDWVTLVSVGLPLTLKSPDGPGGVR